MIEIINTDKRKKPTGICEYKLKINEKLITTFKHRREEGLVTCLRRAADAVEWEKYKNRINM